MTTLECVLQAVPGCGGDDCIPHRPGTLPRYADAYVQGQLRDAAAAEATLGQWESLFDRGDAPRFPGWLREATDHDTEADPR